MPTITSLTQKLADVAACFPGLWIQSLEHQDVHEYFNQQYATYLKREGYDVQMEAQRPGEVPGHCDVLAKRAGQVVAVEIETGKSNVVSNIVRNLSPLNSNLEAL